MVKVGEELTVHYMMDMENAPDWYLDAWDKHSAQNIEEEEKLLQILLLLMKILIAKVSICLQVLFIKIQTFLPVKTTLWNQGLFQRTLNAN